MIAAAWTPTPTNLAGKMFLEGLDLRDARATRERCAWFGRALSDPLVIPGEDGRPYLTRWTIEDGGRSRRVFLHRFTQSDRTTHRHNHPWNRAESVLLAGWYRDERPGYALELGPGDHNLIGSNDFHRVELLDVDVWTLFIVGQVVQTWAFEEITTGVRQPWRHVVVARPFP